MFCLLAVKRSGEDVDINDQKFLHMYICAYYYCDIRLQSPSLTVAVIMKCTVRLDRLQNDPYCVEWDVKLYYTIPYCQIGRESGLVSAILRSPFCDGSTLYWHLGISRLL